LAGLFRGAATADLPPPDAIATIDRPTLVLAWTGDAAHPVETARRLADLLPTAELHEASTAEEVAAWTGRTRDFLASLDL
jgi:pimeloyl-ACP methyl ester carboxylesterase